jgi:alanine dehydrogenase
VYCRPARQIARGAPLSRALTDLLPFAPPILMKIGVPKEIKTNENRVALVPAGAEALVAAGHDVFIESSAGEGSGFSDADYTAVGARIAPDADATWADGDMILKVKEPIEPEWKRIRRGQTLFTYFHFAADERLTRAHLDSGATCIAYETVELPSRELPLLTPMSEVAGRMARRPCCWTSTSIACATSRT